jgi:hypothetical protein
MKSKIFVCCTASAMLALLSFPPNAQAQWWNVGGNAKDPRKPQQQPRARQPVAKDAYKAVSLTKEPELPFLPRWTGRKPLFIEGHYYPFLSPIETYTCSWAYLEPAGTVIGWWREALAGEGWKVNTRVSRENMVVARHGKEPLEIQFQVSPSAKTGYRTVAEVRYTKNPKFQLKEPPGRR